MGDNGDGFRGQGNVESRRIRVGWLHPLDEVLRGLEGLEGALFETEVEGLLNELERW